MHEHIETPCPEGAPCAKVLDNLCDILEVRLGHTEGTAACRKMIDHVRNCPTCWAEVESLCKTVELCKQLPGRHVPGE
ncbi:hypothetical protein GF324_04265, partial [bacterium]|nr:hypothetical protein [bacterium]